MLKVDLIYSSWITAPTGASHFVGRMKEMRSLFAKEGVDLRVISMDLVKERIYANTVSKPKLKSRIGLWLAKHSIILTRLAIYLVHDKPANAILDYYDSLLDKGDVVAFQETIPCYHYLKRRKDNNQKVLLTIHNNGDIWSMWYYLYPRLKSKFLGPFKKNIQNELFRDCDKIGFVADYPRRLFCQLYGVDDKKTYFAYTSIEKGDEPEPMVVGEKVHFITSGTLGDRKNQMGVLNAIGLLPDDYQQKIKYTILSNGDMRDALEKKACSLKAEVIFTGKVDNVDEYLKQANCFVLYSKDEGQPMSIVEAMRVGLPIVGSNIAGIPEQIVEGKTGFVVDLEERNLAECIKYIVDHKEELPSMGKASYELFLSKFTIDAMVRKYATIYKSSVD